MKTAVKTLLIVAPWLVTATLPIWLFPDFAVDSGSIAWSRLAFFDFVLVPLSPILLFRWCWTNPESTFSLLALLLFLGTVAPLVLALGFARFGRRNWFWLLWACYLVLLAIDVVLALVLVKGMS